VLPPLMLPPLMLPPLMLPPLMLPLISPGAYPWDPPVRSTAIAAKGIASTASVAKASAMAARPVPTYTRAKTTAPARLCRPGKIRTRPATTRLQPTNVATTAPATARVRAARSAPVRFAPRRVAAATARPSRQPLPVTATACVPPPSRRLATRTRAETLVASSAAIRPRRRALVTLGVTATPAPSYVLHRNPMASLPRNPPSVHRVSSPTASAAT